MFFFSRLHLWFVCPGQAGSSGEGQPGLPGAACGDGGSVGQLLVSSLLPGRQTETAGTGWQGGILNHLIHVSVFDQTVKTWFDISASSPLVLELNWTDLLFLARVCFWSWIPLELLFLPSSLFSLSSYIWKINVQVETKSITPLVCVSRRPLNPELPEVTAGDPELWPRWENAWLMKFFCFFSSSGNYHLLLGKLLPGGCWAGSEVPWLKGKLKSH